MEERGMCLRKSVNTQKKCIQPPRLGAKGFQTFVDVFKNFLISFTREKKVYIIKSLWKKNVNVNK